MERKTIKFEIKAVDEETGIIEGYGATFSKTPDSYGDVIDPGAFSKTLKENTGSIVSLFNHNVNEPIGLPELTEDSKGLHTRIKLVMEIQKARDVLALAKAGVVRRMSIGYDTIKSDFIDGIRHLKEVRLYDVSPVVFAANQEARILSVKELHTMPNEDLTELEKAALEEMKRRVSESEGKMELKPYPNERSCRLREPGEFQEDSFRRTTRESDGKKYSVIMGKLKGEDAMTEQAFRYDKEVWTTNEAKTHCEEHDGKFEDAEEKIGRVLSAASASKIRAALEALQALLGANGDEEEPKQFTPPEPEPTEAAQLDVIVAGLKAENEGFNSKEAEARIDSILAQLKK